jgi:hypothetical protein
MSSAENPAPRGEAAWLEARDQVKKRNAAARKAGKAEREATEHRRAKARREAETKRDDDLARSMRRR